MHAMITSASGLATMRQKVQGGSTRVRQQEEETRAFQASLNVGDRRMAASLGTK